MRVSIALHYAAPDENGNQRTFEAKYQNYNRRYMDLTIDEAGDAYGICKHVEFPANGETPPEDFEPQFVFSHFSLGVCTGVGTHTGGSIIITGPIDSGIDARKQGMIPTLSNLAVGVHAARLTEMMADGRMPVDEGSLAK